MDHRAEDAAVGELRGPAGGSAGPTPGQPGGEHVDGRVDADQLDALGGEVVGVDALHRAVPAVDALVEARHHAHRGVQGDVLPERRARGRAGPRRGAGAGVCERAAGRDDHRRAHA